MIKIKELKSRTRIWYEGHGEDEVYTVYGYPYADENGMWHIDVTDEGDYCWSFNEGDEQLLHLEVK